MNNLRARFQTLGLMFSALVFAGMALADTVTLSPVAINFGDQIMTTASAPVVVTLSNNTKKTLNVSGVTASGAFQIQSNTCGNSVAAGQACGIGVVFAPITTGPGTGVLSVLSDSQDGTLKTKLSGNGTPILLISITLAATSTSIPLGTTQPFFAIGTYNTGSTQDLTNVVAWTSSAPGVATVNSAGVASSLAQGGTTISASYGGLTGSAT